MVSALAFSAKGHGFDPHSRQEKILVTDNAFLSVICRDDTRSARRPSHYPRVILWIGTLTRGSLPRESHTLCRLKNPTVVYMITCRLSFCKTGVYNAHLLIIIETGCSSMCRKKERLDKSYAKEPLLAFLKAILVIHSFF